MSKWISKIRNQCHEVFAKVSIKNWKLEDGELVYRNAENEIDYLLWVQVIGFNGGYLTNLVLSEGGSISHTIKSYPLNARTEAGEIESLVNTLTKLV